MDEKEFFYRLRDIVHNADVTGELDYIVADVKNLVEEFEKKK